MDENKPMDPLQDQYNIAGSQTQLEVVELDFDEEFEMEIPEELIEYYLEDEEGNEIGFAIYEGEEIVEYFYTEDSEEIVEDVIEVVENRDPETSATKEVLGKVGKAGLSGAKLAGNAVKNVAQGAYGLAQDTIAAGKSGGIAAGAGVVGSAAKETGKNIKEGLPDAARTVKENASVDKLEETFGITKEDIHAVGQELGEIAKGGAEFAGEVKGLIDDLNETFNFSEYTKALNSIKPRRKF